MAYDYLYLVNRLCYKLNEVPLTSSTFASADGVYNDFKEAVNAAILDIYHEEDNEWPFGWQTTTFNTVIGTNEYNKHADALSLDWDSFRIKRAPISIDSITQSSGTATATVSAGHQLMTGDSVSILGANETDYVGSFFVTVTSATEFTFSVSSSASSPATGTIILYPPYETKKLVWQDYDAYRDEGKEEEDDNMIMDGQYNVPIRVVRKSDNNFIISPRPNRIYTIQYDYFTMPDDLTMDTDVPTIPRQFKQVIVDQAMYHAYMFRDNIEQASIIQGKYEKGVNSMRRILIPQAYYMRVQD